MSDWQPIESAPKDGTAIWVADLKAGAMEPVRTQRWYYGEWTNIYTDNSISWKPTHWQPLPPCCPSNEIPAAEG